MLRRSWVKSPLGNAIAGVILVAGLLYAGVVWGMPAARNLQTELAQRRARKQPAPASQIVTPDKSKLAALQGKLSPEQYEVCFLKGTEPPFSGKYNETKDPGAYHCAACGALLFKSDTKFDSKSGWPSFWDMAEDGAVAQQVDRSLGRTQTEVLCTKCGAHLGHVFEGGPPPTGLRYCINSLALEFKPAAAAVPDKPD